MTEGFQALEVVVVTPREGARERLLAIRVRLIAEYRAAFGARFRATLSETDDGGWIDVWEWVDRADAEHALAHRELIPSFTEWEAHVELRSLTWARILPTS